MAHQDDEFGVFQSILDEVKNGNEVICVFLTNGVKNGGDSRVRDSESLDVLTSLGVKEENVIFAGKYLQISDCELLYSLEKAFFWVQEFLAAFDTFGAVYVPAYEGGHPDHDACYVVVSLVCEKMGRLENVKQFPLYNADNCRSFFYKVFNPLKFNGVVYTTDIPLRNRLLFITLIFKYKSQIKSFLGLLPFILYSYFLDGAQKLQSVKPVKLDSPPHKGILYYERRGFCKWEAFKLNVNRFIKCNLSN
jgi:LmbE family N-acetylglucosaminyl deacetylase